ncbi:phosphoribosylformylglycinamidine synthase [Candidatus Peregrinibacteria bacterium]|nr:phosphoribosylformylglycinamidine synthase [Candidatus Peregrinibacteria bacterium]
MAHRICIFTHVNDTKSQVMTDKLRSLEFPIEKATVAEVYTVNKDFNNRELTKISEMLSNPISQKFLIDEPNREIDFDYALEIGFLPGVTDNIATTARETIENYLKEKFKNEESVHTSTLIFLKGQNLNEEIIKNIGDSLANSLIQRIHIKSHEQFATDNGMDTVVPKVKLKAHPKADKVELNIPEEELLKMGKEGIADEDGERRGPLALDKDSMETIKKYYNEVEHRPPYDIELEALAQTWSEHCKHTIFASEIDEIKDGIYKHYIKRATKDIRNAKGDKDFCVSVFKDNSGGIIFDENWVITDKAETHNSPSALDPFGGAITGIVGVNRDTVGFGLGAKPIINKYGFCVGEPTDKEPLYRDKNLTDKLLSPSRILEGVVEGVNAGGNQSGIPTPQGFVYFEDRYKGKPLIFVGTIGLIPKEINGQPGWEKSARPGDKIVVIGGRVGQDGIHGATFSSEALSSGSPATAVQIGDPITQKKASDAIVKEARDKGLYNSITDNGAGGISCSVAEMAKECGGCTVELNKVPLKYPNLEPWKIWVSESQERFTLAIPPEKIDEFFKLMEKWGVEATIIGEFNDSTRCIVNYNGETIMDMDMQFLHYGNPKKILKTTYTRPTHKEPDINKPADLTDTLHSMLSRPNIASFEFISKQYDHNVQGITGTKPLQGPGRVNAKATVTLPFPGSTKGIICSQGINPRYSDIDTYHMAASAIDTAVRNAISVGADPDYIALMDNFCWCSSDDPERLGQLKAAAKACYDYATAYSAPFISGKDSMFNDFKGFNQEGKRIKISVPPTLLISSLSVIDDITLSLSLDPKFEGDLIYILGETANELGGSEYFASLGYIGNSVPKVDAQKALKLYKLYHEALKARLISSSYSPEFGGIGAALARKAIAGQIGMEINLNRVPHTKNLNREDHLLFSETQSRFIVTIDPKRKEEFEKHFANVIFAQIGTITEDQNFIIKGFNGENIIKSNVKTLEEYYKKTFKDF